MTESAFPQAALALGAGMTAQVVAARIGIPSIVLLLVAGVAVGPDVLNLLDPGAFGDGRAALVSLAVTVILFEGALALDVQRLRQQQRSLLLLLTLGGAISMAAGTLAAYWFLGFSWPVAILYGATMIVTGPTVVTPLLARLTVARPVRELLVSEGVLIDPIGAIVAIVAVDAVIGEHGVLTSGWLVVLRLGVGAAVGTVAGLVLAGVLRRRWIPDELINPAVLAGVLLSAAAASAFSTESGLMAAVAQGVLLANVGLRDIGRLRQFKEALTVILLSFLFIVLAAGLRLGAVHTLGWRALAVVAVLAGVARPVAVFAATAGSDFTVPQRAFIASICPRGIVAAAVAGLFHILLDRAGIAGGGELEALVFVTVAVTVTMQGLTAGPIARLLGVDHPVSEGVTIVGADELGRLLARLLQSRGRRVVLVDKSHAFCRRGCDEQLSVYEGDALADETLEDVGVRYADTVVTLTRNPELNALVARRVRDEFRTDRVLALGADGDDAASGSLFPGRFPGVDEANRQLRLGLLDIVTYVVPPDAALDGPLSALPYADGEFALLFEHGEGVWVAVGEQRPAPEDRIWCARPAGASSPLAALLPETSPGPDATVRAAGS